MSTPQHELGDPSTSPQRLFEIAQSNPELGSLIAAHPNAYPELKQWVANLAPAQPEAAVDPTPTSAEPAAAAAPEAAPATPNTPQAPQAFNPAPAAQAAAPQAFGAAPTPGQPTQAYPTQAYPTADQSQFTQPTTPLGGGFPGGPGAPASPVYAGGAQPPKKSRKGLWITIISIVLVAALAVTGGLIWWNLSSKTSGSSTPEAAANKVLDSVSTLDQLSIYGSLAPSEIGAFQNAFDKWSKEAGVDENSKVSDKVKALADTLDVKIEGIETEVTELMTGVQRVTYTAGTITVDGDKAKVIDAAVALYEASIEESPGQEMDPQSLRKSLDRQLELPTTLNFADLQDERIKPSVVVVQEGDLWYMSPMLTVADSLYLASGGSQDALGTELIEGKPSSSPEAAATDLAEAIMNADDLGDIAAHLPLAERRLISIYGQGFKLPRGWNDDFTLESAEFSAVTENPLARLSFKDLTLDFSVSSRAAGRDLERSITFSGHCAEMNGEQYNSRTRKVEKISDEQCLSDLPVYEDLGLDNLALIAVEEDGGWYLSPLHTVADAAAIVTAHIAKLAQEGRLEEVFEGAARAL